MYRLPQWHSKDAVSTVDGIGKEWSSRAGTIKPITRISVEYERYTKSLQIRYSGCRYAKTITTTNPHGTCVHEYGLT